MEVSGYNILRNALQQPIRSTNVFMCVAAASTSLSKMAEESFEQMYNVENIIGNGGFGVVYAGTRKRDGLPVSVFNVKHVL